MKNTHRSSCAASKKRCKITPKASRKAIDPQPSSFACSGWPNRPSWSEFWRPTRPTWRPRRPTWRPRRPTWRPRRPTWRPRGALDRPGECLGTPWDAPRRPGSDFGSIWGRFGVDLGSLRTLSERRFIDYLASMLPTGRPRWLHLAALVALGRPGWLSKAKKRLAFRLSASTLPASLALHRYFMPQI